MGEARRRFAIVRFDDAALDRLGQADERFFDRYPHRCHRLRLAGQAEIAALARGYGASASAVDSGERLFVVVKRIFPGGYLKSFVANRAEADTDVPEDLVAILFDRLTKSSAEIRIMEAAMRRTAAEERP